jgi:tetratricopeptide (TPR) repeat protein
MELKEYDKSEKYLKESLTIKNKCLSNTDPILIDAYLGIGSLYQNMGMPILAEEFYLKALVVSKEKYQELDTNQIKTYFYLVDFYKWNKERACAIDYYQKIEEILKQNLINKPQLVDILIQEGFYYWDINDIPCAIEKMNMALENIEDDKGVTPKTIEVLYQSLGDLNFYNDNNHEAVYYYEKLLDYQNNGLMKKNDYYFIQQKLGYCQYRIGNLEKAEKFALLRRFFQMRNIPRNRSSNRQNNLNFCGFFSKYGRFW